MRRSSPVAFSRFRARSAVSAVTLAVAAVVLAGATVSPPPPGWRLPARPSAAITGSEFARSTIGAEARVRQARAVEELLAGNVPDFLRRSVPIELRGEAGGRERVVVLRVSSDYLSIGSDEDFLRMPLGRPSASRVLLAVGATLPTPRIVDAVHAAAKVRLRPDPLPPGPTMRSSRYFLRHRQLVEAQRNGLDRPLGDLVAGHKKDVVLSRRLIGRPDRIAIYGWHRADGAPIQPLSLVHGTRYADYSHGIRLVSEHALLDGEPRDFWDLLADPEIAPLISDEGPIPEARELLRVGARTR